MLKELTEDNFQEVLESSEKVIFDFYSPSCRPCKMIEKILEEINEEQPISIYKCNMEESYNIFSKYKIQGVPTLIFIENGEEVNRIVGRTSKDAITEAIGV